MNVSSPAVVVVWSSRLIIHQQNKEEDRHKSVTSFVVKSQEGQVECEPWRHKETELSHNEV